MAMRSVNSNLADDLRRNRRRDLRQALFWVKALHIIAAVARILTWLGGVAFVASLAYAAYVYAVVLADPAADSGAGLGPAIAINALLFGVFALHHSALARTSAKRAITRVVP